MDVLSLMPSTRPITVTSAMPAASRGGNEQLKNLQSWYLARMRQAALADDLPTLTPSGLVAADKHFVQALVLKHANAADPGQDSIKLKTVLQLATVALVLSLMLNVAVVAILALAPGQIRLLTILVSVVLGLNGGIAALFFWQRQKLLSHLGQLIERYDKIFNLEGKPEGIEDGDPLSRLANVVRNAASELRKANERELAIADYAANLTCSLGPKGVVLAASKAASRFLGIDSSTLVGMQIGDLLTPSDALHLTKHLERVRGQAETSIVETRLLRVNSTPVDVRWSVEWSESAQCYFCIAIDVTAEKELHRLRQQFISMIGHDLKAPLSSLRLTFESLECGVYGEFTPEASTQLSRAQITCDRLLSLISQTLDFELVESGGMQPVYSTVDMSDAATHILESLEPLAEGKRVALINKIEQISIQADELRMTQLISNLVSNAIKFTAADSSVILKSLCDPDYIRIEVCDEGPGIEPEKAKTLFQRFKQLSIEDRKQGSGLGLAISKAIVESHGGQIGVESNAEKGCIFWFTLPRQAP